jgi:hypothetical protein
MVNLKCEFMRTERGDLAVVIVVKIVLFLAIVVVMF